MGKLITFSQISGGNNLISTVNTLAEQLSDQASQITAIRAMIVPIMEQYTLPVSNVTSIVLTNTPNDIPVEVYINGILYLEDEAFIIDRETKTLVWTFTPANGGFDINNSLAEHITIKYSAGIIPENASTLKTLRSDELPTSGSYSTGDIIFRAHPTSAQNIGWICTSGGVGDQCQWAEFGIVDFANIFMVEEENNESSGSSESSEESGS